VQAKNNNPDTVAWLYLPGTKIDDSVLQADNNNFYLQRTFEGEYSVWGSYFADYLNTLDSRDTLDANTVIYGHSYKTEEPNERKFTQLFRYCDIDFVRENPCIHLSLDGEDLVFQVCAVFFTDISFDYISPNPPEDFYTSVAAKNEFNFDGLPLAPGDKVLTLSTCSYRYDTEKPRDQRLVIMGKRLPEDTAVQDVTITVNPDPERP
jgi:sortase B